MFRGNKYASGFVPVFVILSGFVPGGGVGVLTSAAPKASANEMALRIRYIKRDSKAQISRYNRRTSQDRFAINAENGFE